MLRQEMFCRGIVIDNLIVKYTGFDKLYIIWSYPQRYMESKGKWIKGKGQRAKGKVGDFPLTRGD